MNRKIFMIIFMVIGSLSLNMKVEASNNYEYYYELTEEDIKEEEKLGDMELIAQLVQAEAGWNISDEAFEAVKLEYENRTNFDILYFSRGKSKYMKNESFKYQDHWFGW